MSYKAQVSPAAHRDIKRLDKQTRETIREVLVGLTSDPRPPGCRKLVGWDRRYRIRVGRMRIIYDVIDTDRLIIVDRIVPRTETTYRRL